MKSHIRNMSNKIKIGAFIFMFLAIWDLEIKAQSNQQTGKGAVIVADFTQPVRFIDQAGKEINFGNELRGSIITEGQTAEVGKGGKLVLLFSNGTITTLQSETKMKIGVFEQIPFEAGDEKVADLDGEPSESKLELDLEWGSLVVKTKKLDKKSTFDINSPLGTAGIRGTEFQLSQNPGAGIQLDVTESTVAFTPPGGAPMPITQGNGLDVSSAGVSTPRPVNPAIAQNISATNQSATQVTNDIPLGSVSEAMTEASASVESSGGSGGESIEEGSKDPADSNDDGPGQDPSKSENAEERKGPRQEQRNSNRRNNRSSRNLKSQVLENNSEIKEVRKTGRVTIYSKSVAKFGLNTEQTTLFNSFPLPVQNRLLSLGANNLKRMLNISGFGTAQASTFLNYSRKTQNLILLLEDNPLISLLNQKIDESVLTDLLTPQNLAASNSGKIPDGNVVSSDAAILSLGDKLKESGNSDLMDELKVLSGDNLTSDWIRKGEVANVLTQDYSLSSVSASDLLLSGQEVLENPFYLEISSLYGLLEQENLVAGNSNFVGGRVLNLDTSKLDLGSVLYNQANTIVFSGSESLKLATTLEVTAPSHKATRVVLMSGENLESEKGVTLKSATSDLVLASRKDIILENVQLESSREIALRSLRDINLKNATLSATNLATIRATRDLNIDGLKFSREIPNILMEATTLRLSDVNFPASSMVRLNSLKGAIDGKYPNFGTSIPNAEQIGRVNFIKNVSSGGNLMNNRQSFDQFGGNISIGKVALP